MRHLAITDESLHRRRLKVVIVVGKAGALTRAYVRLLKPADRTRLMDRVRTELVPRLGTDEDPLPDEREDNDDPYEATLLEYQQAFKDAGDLKAAAAFGEALDASRQRPTASREDYEPDPDYDTGGFAGYRSMLAPQPTTERSIFDDIDR